MANVMYDSVGNLTKDAANRSFTYDMENRQASFNNTTATYHYDGEGRRVKKVDSTGTTIYVYNLMGQMIADYTTVPPPPQAQTSYVTQDQLGSTRVVTDQSQVVKARYDYLPFGEEIPATLGARSTSLGYGNTDKIKQKFTSKERDTESKLDYFGARYYSGAQGRFTSADPMAVTTESFVNPQRLNLYIYVNNNPMASQDPNGEDGEGKGGDKTISVFLEISASQRNTPANPKTPDSREDGPGWEELKGTASDNGYKLNLHGPKELTGDSLESSKKEFEAALNNSEVVIYIGHGFGSTGSPGDRSDRQFAPTYVQVGDTAYGNGGSGLPLGDAYIPTGPKPTSSTPVLGTFACNSNANPDYVKVSNNQIQVTINSGKDGYTAVGTLEKAAHAFIKAYLGQTGSRETRVKAGLKAANKVIAADKNVQYKKKLINNGDKAVSNAKKP